MTISSKLQSCGGLHLLARTVQTHVHLLGHTCSHKHRYFLLLSSSIAVIRKGCSKFLKFLPTWQALRPPPALTRRGPEQTVSLQESRPKESSQQESRATWSKKRVTWGWKKKPRARGLSGHSSEFTELWLHQALCYQWGRNSATHNAHSTFLFVSDGGKLSVHIFIHVSFSQKKKKKKPLHLQFG